MIALKKNLEKDFIILSIMAESTIHDLKSARL
jgi:hypothetical protein